MNDKRPLLLLAAVATALLLFAATLPVSLQKEGFFSDEATYYAMAYSLAYDGDIRYEAHDLERVYDNGWEAGPAGIFLRYDEPTGRMYYAKAFAYSAAAAPFVRAFGDNGFFLLHALLLAGVLIAGYAYLRRVLEARWAVAWVLAYFLGSIALLYYFWITPEIFNLAVGFFATFLWLYKERPPGWPEVMPWEPHGWLAGAWTDVAAAVLYGVAAYSKPPSIILLGPMLAWLLWRKRNRRLAVVAVVALATVVGLFAATHATTGDWNYMGGDRRTFHGPYPFQYRQFGFHDIGTAMVTDVSEYQNRFPRVDHLAADLVAYVWVGRNGGVLIYMLPAFLAALAYAASSRRQLVSPYSLLIAATVVNALAYMTVIQANWIGGGGTIGSRYFMGLYYAPFFAIPAGVAILGPLITWVVWGLFLSQIMLDPWGASMSPGRHTKAFPFSLLPPEMGMLNDLPFNTDPRSRRVELTVPGGLDVRDDFDLYFLDDATYLREGALPGFWVKSRSRAEVVLRAEAPVRRLLIKLTNGPVANRVTVSVDGEMQTVALAADEQTSVLVQPTTRFTFGNNWVYRIVVVSHSGGVPMLHDDDNEDFRHLGVFVAPDPVYD